MARPTGKGSNRKGDRLISAPRGLKWSRSVWVYRSGFLLHTFQTAGHPPNDTGNLRLDCRVGQKKARSLGPEPAVPVASTKSPLRDTVRIEALRGIGWVLNPEGCGYRAKLKRSLEEARIPFRVVVEAPDPELQMQLIRTGVGAGIIPGRALPTRLEEAGLQTFRIADIIFSLDAWLVHRRAGPIIPVAMPLIEAAVSAALKPEATAPKRRLPSRSGARRPRGTPRGRAR